MTEKLNQRKIVLIALLRSKGINDKQLFAKILRSTKRSLNLIHSKHIKHTRINDKLFLKHLLKPRSFSKDFLLVDKISIICTEINKILVKRYHNNKSNVLFQEFIDYILDYLLTFKSTHLSFDLYTHIKQNYKVTREINIIHETRLVGKYTLEQLKLVNELIDHIDYINFFNNDITKLQRLRMKKSFDLEGYFIDFCNDVEQFAKENKDLKPIYDRLIFNNGNIDTKLLYNQLIRLKQNLHETLHQINYGITTTDSASSKDKANISNELSSEILPFSESGALEITDKQFNALNINTIFCNKNHEKFIKAFKNHRYNNKPIDGEINVLSEGENIYNKGKFNRSYFIHYQYITTLGQQKQYKTLLNNLKESMINDSSYNTFDNFEDHIRCTYNYPYYNQKSNFDAFKQYFKENIDSTLNVKYRHLYPYSNKRNNKKNKYLSTISWNNNAFKGYALRTRINRNLANIIYNIDLNRQITNFYNPSKQLHYNKRKQRIFLKDLLAEIKAKYLKRFNGYLQSLIDDYKNRIYLFETYGIKALINQIGDLTEFYNKNFVHKNVKQARLTKKAINTLEQLLPLRKQYIEFLNMQKLTIENNLKDLKPTSVLIQRLLHENIEFYLRKTVIRKIDTSRSSKELVLMACNNLKPLCIDYMNSMPVYVKQINNNLNKFDELLNDSENYEVEYIDKKSKINVNSLFKAITQFDRYFNLNDLYMDILEINVTDKTKLKDYIYKEKLILNA